MPNVSIFVPVHLIEVLKQKALEHETVHACAKRLLFSILEPSLLTTDNQASITTDSSLLTTDNQASITTDSDSLLTTDYLARIESLEQSLTQVTSQVTNLPSQLPTDYLEKITELEQKVEALSAVVESEIEGKLEAAAPALPDGLDARLEILEQLANSPLTFDSLPIELQERIEKLEETLALLLEVSAKGVVLPQPLVEKFEKLDDLQGQFQSFRELLQEAFAQLEVLHAEKEAKETPNTASPAIEGEILPCLVDEEAPKKKAGRPSKNKNLSAPL